MQIRKPVVPKKFFLNAFKFFGVKWVYHKLHIFQYQIFDTNLPSLIYTVWRYNARHCPAMVTILYSVQFREHLWLIVEDVYENVRVECTLYTMPRAEELHVVLYSRATNFLASLTTVRIIARSSLLHQTFFTSIFLKGQSSSSDLIWQASS